MSPCRDGGGGSSPLARGLREELARERFACRIIPARAGFTEQSFSSTIRLEDHPRSRGVYIPLKVSDVPKAGSSPLARGLRAAAERDSHISWIIPARAGFTAPTLHAYDLDHRIIPARAGFTNVNVPDVGANADHPRSRGVYHTTEMLSPYLAGSSPLARGLHFSLCRIELRGGIIPARAGFTAAPHLSLGCWWDHPRSRGVY